MSGGPLLVVDDLMLRFGGITALDGVSFELRAGELLALIGPNGAGKTSILNCLNGVYRPQRGSIRLQGCELIGAAPPARSSNETPSSAVIPPKRSTRSSTT
ncbi:MAG TPA: ATP-binding cassette domain-containing protein, partial [Solirubrobacteraceae bacterium]|nr:ATP-binding cassette domain-containing protein [Solirubrobacteraceae bacterium]